VVATTTKEFFIGFRFMDTPGFGENINLFLRRFGVIGAVISGCWGGARDFGRIVGESGSNRVQGIPVVSVAGSDLLIFGVD
jgi:hypothetical protein